MNVPQNVLEHKTLMVAMLACAGEIADQLELDMSMSVTAMSRQLGANRSSAYQQMQRLVGALTQLATARPGRPPVERDSERPSGQPENALTIRVLEHRLEHLDSVIEHPRRTSYSPSFRRFILGELDRWEGDRSTFADACRIPQDTLKDWVRDDRAGMLSAPPAKPEVPVPVDASEMTKKILQDYRRWEQSTKAFLSATACRCGLTTSQVRRVLAICGAIAPRSTHRFRHRGTTTELCPGSLLVTDGKTLDIELTGSGRRRRLTWQGTVDQATGCDTAVVVTEEETAWGVLQAYRESVEFLGGEPPIGLLHDNRPCNYEARLREAVSAAGTLLVPATVGRPENKALLEGAFSLFEKRVGTIRLDDTNLETLIKSAASEVVRGYTSATNHVPRAELGGTSRLSVLRAAAPSRAALEADRAFIANLKASHEAWQLPSWYRRKKEESRRLLDHWFAKVGFEHLDPNGKLRAFLSVFEAAAIRMAAAVVEVRLERDDLERQHAHRYFAKVVQSMQHQLDLERHSKLLLELCRLQNQDWVSVERAEYEELKRDNDAEALACALAERAARGGLPVSGTYWTERLLEQLEKVPDALAPVSRFLERLYEAPYHRRLYLLDLITARHWGIA